LSKVIKGMVKPRHIIPLLRNPGEAVRLLFSILRKKTEGEAVH